MTTSPLPSLLREPPSPFFQAHPPFTYLDGGESSGAVISNDELFRYHLWRIWDVGPRVCFVLLNPSTASGTKPDNTVRRCVGFARGWGYSGMEIVNLFALRSRDPKKLRKVEDPVGPHTMAIAQRVAQSAQMTVAGWGIHGHLFEQGRQMRAALSAAGVEASIFGLTSGKEPLHPLFLKGDLWPMPWPRSEAPAAGARKRRSR